MDDICRQIEMALGLAKTKTACEVCSQLGYQLIDEHFGANSLAAAPFNTWWTRTVSRRMLSLSTK